MHPLKKTVQQFWEDKPCGFVDAEAKSEGSLEFFEEVERQRYTGDCFMREVVGFERWRGKRMLEVGCGMGTDLLQFARGGAEVFGIDLTSHGAGLTKKRLELYGFEGKLSVADSETLPFADNSFDLVYSWGVIHHTPDTSAAAKEIMRVCKPGGRVIVMLYHIRSLLALQAWLLYGLMRGKPFSSPRELIAKHVESPGTKTYTVEQAKELFNGLKSVQVQTIVTRYDLRIGRRLFLPGWVRPLIPSGLGWFIVINGAKASN